MVFLCSENHEVRGSWRQFRNKKNCPICELNPYKTMDNTIQTKKANSKRILGLDQATKVTGYSIFEDGKLIKYGTFSVQGDDTMVRNIELRNWMISIIKSWQIDAVGIEGIQFQTNVSGGARVGVTTFEALARLQGVLMAALEDLQIPYKVCHTQTWRSYCKVKGRSRTDKKRSMQLIIKNQYDVSVSEDEADAIGIGKFMNETFQVAGEYESWED